jgi:hypothetical protein
MAQAALARRPPPARGWMRSKHRRSQQHLVPGALPVLWVRVPVLWVPGTLRVMRAAPTCVSQA